MRLTHHVDLLEQNTKFLLERLKRSTLWVCRDGWTVGITESLSHLHGEQCRITWETGDMFDHMGLGHVLEHIRMEVLCLVTQSWISSADHIVGLNIYVPLPRSP